MVIHWTLLIEIHKVLIHTHNLKTGLGDLLLTYTYNHECHGRASTPGAKSSSRAIMKRTGRVALHMAEVWIIPAVGCVNNVASAVERATRKYMTDQIDGVSYFFHILGCSQMGDDQNNTRQILADL